VQHVCGSLCGAFVDLFGRRTAIAFLGTSLTIPVFLLLGYSSTDPIFMMIMLGASYSVCAAVLWPSIQLLVTEWQTALPPPYKCSSASASPRRPPARHARLTHHHGLLPRHRHRFRPLRRHNVLLGHREQDVRRKEERSDKYCYASSLRSKSSSFC